MSKEGYFKEDFDENKKDTRKVWSIRSIVNIKQTNRYQPSNLIIEKLISVIAIANHFNYLFTNIAGEIGKTIGPSNKPPMTIYAI